MFEENNKSPRTKLPKRLRTKIIEVVKGIPSKCSLEDLTVQMEDVFVEIKCSTLSERPLVYEALTYLKDQPAIVQVLINRYEALRIEDLDERFLTIQVLGELCHPDAFRFLRSEIWKSLPPPPKNPLPCTAKSDRQTEEEIRVKAVHGLAYLRSEESYEEIIKIMLEHESISVRIAAINSYMWNKGDSQEAATKLYGLLPQEFHPYVERPRFHRNMDAMKFELQTISWLNKWMKKGELPKNPIISSAIRSEIDENRGEE